MCTESDEITVFFRCASVSSEFGPLLNPHLCVYFLGNSMPIIEVASLIPCCRQG